MDLTYLQQVRDLELQQIVQLLPAAASILELGAGSGWQAEALARKGFQVSAIDVPDVSMYQGNRVFPVQEYDGKNIPFSNQSFDIVFSSHVMEHVVEFDQLQKEIIRVLKPSGIAVHIVPTPTWRVLTLLTHYPGVIKEVIQRLNRSCRDSKAPDTTDSLQVFSPHTRKVSDYILRFLWPHRHGERGNAFSEIFYFSGIYWRKKFESNQFLLQEVHSNHLFYSGYALFGQNLAKSMRAHLAKVFGGSGQIFLLRPNLDEQETT